MGVNVRVQKRENCMRLSYALQLNYSFLMHFINQIRNLKLYKNELLYFLNSAIFICKTVGIKVLSTIRRRHLQPLSFRSQTTTQPSLINTP